VATREAILAIKVVSDTTQAAAGLDDTSRSTGRFAGAMQKAVVPALAVGAAVVAIGKKALDSASNLQQSEGAVEAVFGKSADAVKAYAADADTALGLSASSYNQYAALVGTALQNAGFSAREAVEESNRVMERGADLSALYGGTTAEAVEAINAAVSRSEFDPLEKYGVSLNMTAVNAELAAKGQDKLTGAALDTAKKAIILEQIYDKSGKAAGQFSREADSAAGSAQIASAQWENASAALGQALLPAAAAVAGKLAALAGWLERHRTITMVLIGLLGAFAAAILVVNVAIKAMTLATMIAGSTAAKAWLKILGPIGLVILAITAVVLVVRHLWKTSETFRSVVLKVWGAIKAGARGAVAGIKTAWNAMIRAIAALVRGFSSTWRSVSSAIRSTASAVVTYIRSLWSGLVSRLRSLTTAFSSAARSAWSAIRSAFSTAVSAIRSLWSGAISALKSAASGLGAILAKPFNIVESAVDAVKSAIDSVINAVQSLINKIGSIHFPKIPDLNPFGRSVAPATAGGTVAPFAARTGALGGRGLAPSVAALGTGGGGGGLVVINVTGALDPEGVARQIRGILDSHDRRIGGRVR
jgi:hypothetical protein